MLSINYVNTIAKKSYELSVMSSLSLSIIIIIVNNMVIG